MRFTLFVLSALTYTSVEALNLGAVEQDYDQALFAQTYTDDIKATGDCMIKKLSGAAGDKKAPGAAKCGAPAPAPAPKPTDAKEEKKCDGDAKAPAPKTKEEEKKEECAKKSVDATTKATTDAKAALDKAQAKKD